MNYRTAILGLSDQSLLLLECAVKAGLFKIEAVADKDGELAQKVAAQYGCAHYDDYRVAVTQTGLDIVFAAAPLHACAEYIRTALARKMHVLRIAPPARTFEELAEFVRQADSSGVIFGVAASLRLSRAYAALRQRLRAGQIENIFFVTAQCGASQSHEPWRRDPKLAGGGVLLYDCYEIIDQIVQIFGAPDEIYAVCTSQAPDRKQRLYVTEDTAVVTMKFADTLTINIIAGKTLKPHEHILNVYGKQISACISSPVVGAGFKSARKPPGLSWGLSPEGALYQPPVVTGGSSALKGRDNTELPDVAGSIKSNFMNGCCLSILDDQNNIIEEFNDSETPQEAMSRILADFVQTIAEPDKAEPLSNGSDHLAAMALIESAYLSARTGAPESPQRILQMSQSTMSRYLK
jgi:predicted dehydrogenase